MFKLAYNVTKFIAIFLLVSVAITFVAILLPQYKAQLEYVGWATLVVAEVWAFTRGRKFQFSLRQLMITMTLAALALGLISWAAKK